MGLTTNGQRETPVHEIEAMAQASEVAEVLGARVERFDGAGHFWPCQAPDRGAAILESFWTSLT